MADRILIEEGGDYLLFNDNVGEAGTREVRLLDIRRSPTRRMGRVVRLHPFDQDITVGVPGYFIIEEDA